MRIRFKYYFLFFFLIQSKIIGFAQNGYGPPVYKQDFGFGNADPATIGSSLPAGRTSFTFDKAVCPAPGNYTIARRVPVSNCFNEWIDLSHDNNVFVDYGMMMMVNNITTDNNRVVYVDTINQSMCPGALYSFSVAMINLDLVDGWKQCPNLSPTYPIFELRIEDGAGNLVKKDTTAWLVSYAARPLMGYKFSEQGFGFTMPAGVNQLILRITLLRGPYICAEDFAIDDIQIRPLGPNAVINFDNEPSTTIVKSVCFQHNKTVSLSGTVGAYYTNTALQWQQTTDNGITWTDIPGATSLTYSRVFSVADTFLFRLTAGEAATISNPYCRVASNTRRLEVDGIPAGYKITSNSPVCAGQNLQFNAEGGASYNWTGPNGFYDNVSYAHIFFSSLADSGWYYVEVYSLGGCVKKDSIHAMVIGTDVRAGPDTAICKGNSVQLAASHGNGYIWSPATGLSSANIRNPRAKPEVTTTYIVEVKDNAGCSDTAHVEIRVLNATEIKAAIEGADFLCRVSDSASFKDISKGNISVWNWDFGNGHSSLSATPPTQYYTIPGNTKSYTVRLAVADTVGCADTAYHVVRVADNCYIAVPSAFTPNNDGLNDHLYPLNAYKATDLLFRVYNRSGQKVFETRDWTRKWDGKLKGLEQETGVYVWMLNYIDASGKKVSLKGTTTLIR